MNRFLLIGAIAAFLTTELQAAGQEEEPVPGPTTLPMVDVKAPMLRSLATFRLARIPAGSIEIPATQPGEKARVFQIKSFWIGTTELPWDAYDGYRYAKDHLEDQANKMIDAKVRPSRVQGHDPARGFGYEGYPTISIPSQAAILYCKWLSEMTGKVHRLPTEAEWEYACRAGGPPEDLTNMAKHREFLENIAWYFQNSKDENGVFEVTHPVGTKLANPWGLHDMLGNAAEWAVAADDTLVVKGGAFDDKAPSVHSRARKPYHINWQLGDPQDPKSRWWLASGPHAGFRIVREE